MISEINQPQKDKYLWFHLYEVLRVVIFTETEGRMVVAGVGGRRSVAWRCCLMDIDFLFLKNLVNLFMAMLGLGCCVGFSLVVESGGYFLVVVERLLIAVVSLLWSTNSSSCGFSSCSIWASNFTSSRAQA